MENLNFTIAVMIHNVEEFLPECIESCISQKGNDLEIILIDDGSTDNCSSICDDYGKKDYRIRVIHKKNGGVSSARNTAIRNARGKWLVMVDGDDMLTDDAIEYGRKYVNDDSELLQFDAVTFTDTLSLKEWKPKGQEMVVTGEELKEYHFQLIDRSNAKMIFPTYNINPAWSKIWNMDFIRKYDLWYNEEVHKGEGTLFTFCASYKMHKFKIIPHVLYGYRINQSSIMHRFSADILDNQNVQWIQYYKVICEHDEQDKEDIINLLNRRGLYLIENAIYLGIAHPDCNYSFKQKIAWANKLCGFPWVEQAVEYQDKTGKISKVNKLILHNDARALVRYCDWIKTKYVIRKYIKNILGTVVVKYYRKLRYGKSN